MDRTITVTNANGRPFTARLAFPGEFLTNGFRQDVSRSLPDAHAVVEFFDATYAHQQGFYTWGQKVAEYHVSTLLAQCYVDDGPFSRYDHAGRSGLDLYGAEPAWKVDAAAMRVVSAWLEHECRAPHPAGTVWEPDNVDLSFAGR